MFFATKYFVKAKYLSNCSAIFVPWQISDDLRGDLSAVFKADWTTEDKCLETIKSTFEQTGYALDTHTAVAKDVADRFANPNQPLIISATAHYSKFSHDVLRGLQQSPTSQDPVELFATLSKVVTRPAPHRRLENAISRPQIHKTVCNADVSTVKNEIDRFLSRWSRRGFYLNII